ncbi:hypothetical protein [Roseisalinus antarcticus]|uniref:Uncharacterized protein n=1 Tax=Roseisalinus antarcticus TaxID=254357 RepID=A0A1Y5SFH2_9RHOB|nr:hypothetical protein [Roseisalinus antarcticus]SLN39622.1 hypothetical protein ROA7023_01520 [Roseisalinus antarcticus]
MPHPIRRPAALARMLTLAACLALPAAPAPAQGIETALKLGSFILDLRRQSREEDAAEEAADRLDARLGEVIEAQISRPDLSGLLDARLDALELRRLHRTVQGAVLRLDNCAAAPALCADDLPEIDRILRQVASEIAASPASDITLGLLERARSAHLRLARLQDADPARIGFLQDSYARYFGTLASTANRSAYDTARQDLLRPLAALIDVPQTALELSAQTDLQTALAELVSEQGSPILLSGLRRYFDGNVRFMDATTGAGSHVVRFNCRLNRSRLAFLDGRVAPRLHMAKLRDLVEDEDDRVVSGAPAPGDPYELIWLAVGLSLTDGGARIEAAEQALVDDAAGTFTLPYGGEFYTFGSRTEPASVPVMGAAIDAQILDRLGVFPWTGRGPCLLTDGLVLEDPRDGLSELEAALQAHFEKAETIVAALVQLENLRRLAGALAEG